MSASLAPAARAALECLGVSAADRVLVVCNAAQRAIADALVAAATPSGAAATLLEYPETTRHGEEPPADVAEAMLGATAILAPTTFSVSHTRARIAATAAGARVATLPGVTEDMFRRTMPVDYAELRRVCGAIAARFTAASTCRVTTAAGTDLTLSLAGRDGRSDDGDLRRPGVLGNLPAGEGYIAPVETEGDGVLVVDACLAGHGLLREPCRVTVENGQAVAAEGEAAEWLLATLDAGGPTGRLVAELAIGTNPRATLTGLILEDEKAVGTVHVAFGTNASIGGANQSAVHIDGVIHAPTVDLDGETVMRDGRLLIA